MSFPVPPAQTLIGNIRRTYGAEKIQMFTYNFLTDGGAVGTYGTGITIPQFAIFTFLTYRIITAVAGAGASIGVGWAGMISALDTQAAPIASNLVVSMTTKPSAPGFPILFSILAAPLTAGKIVIALQYIDEPLN